MEDGKVQNQFRMESSLKVKEFFQNEIQIRRTLYIKYKKINSICNIVNKVSAGLAMATGVGGIAVSSTVVMLPLTIELECITIIAGLSTIISTILNKYSYKKVKKHKEIKNIAIESSITINKIISDALDDGIIEKIEFDLIQKHYQDYFNDRTTLQKKYDNISI